MTRKRRNPNPIDEQLLRWEQARGTMPPDDQLGTEWYDGDRPPPVDPARVRKVREAYKRTRNLQRDTVAL